MKQMIVLSLCFGRERLHRMHDGHAEEEPNPVPHSRLRCTVQAGCGVKLDELVSVQICLFLFNSVFHACVYLFYLIQFFMHAR